MEKAVFRRRDREDDAVAATAVRTRHADHDRVQLDGLVVPSEVAHPHSDSPEATDASVASGEGARSPTSRAQTTSTDGRTISDAR